MTDHTTDDNQLRTELQASARPASASGLTSPPHPAAYSSPEAYSDAYRRWKRTGGTSERKA